MTDFDLRTGRLRKALLTLPLLAAWLLAAASAAELNREQSGKIALVVGQILQQFHYLQRPLNDSLSQIFLTNYLDSLDYNHMFFLQSDVDEFRERYGASLDEAIRKGDASPAFAIYERFVTRLDQRHQLVQKLLEEKFDFTTDESFLPTRNKLPWPKDEAEARALWQLRIKFELLQGRLAKEKSEEPLKTVAKRYQRLVKTMRDFDTVEILQYYLTALGRAYDPHTDYMGPAEATNFDINTVKLSLSGIGALLRWEDGYTRIERVLPGGPAERSKLLKPGDRIIAVAQGDSEPVDVIEMKLTKVVDMIRGTNGTEVRLTIIPATEAMDGSVKKVIRLIRENVKLTEQLAKARIVDRPDGAGKTNRLGVIVLPQFYENCSRDVEKLLSRLNQEHINGLILDLRHNGGGILEDAVRLTGLFIKDGPVVQVKDRAGKSNKVLEDDDPAVVYGGPLVVAVGHMSASASEIVAAALQDYGRALIAGDQSTHGKGTVQTIYRLKHFLPQSLVADPGEVKFTVSKFYRIAGTTTQKIGVTPDITLPSVFDYMELGESTLPNCLPADNTTPLEYNRFDYVRPFVAQLQKNSSVRITRDPEFAYVLEDIARLKQQQADKNVSLNETKRLKEIDEQKAREESRKKERAKRKPANEKVFELTVGMVDKNEPISPLASLKPKPPSTTNFRPTVTARKDPKDTEDEDTEPALDAPLEETLNILADYTKLLGPYREKLITGKPAALSPL